MARLLLLSLLAFSIGCVAHHDGAVSAREERVNGDEVSRLANLERAVRYPWKDDGQCAVRESSGDWATLVERCYDALDHSRIQFTDQNRVCPLAHAGAISADQAIRLVGICLLVQPELAVGAVVVIGAVVIAAAISAEIEAARAKKQGCYCRCFKGNDGVYPEGRVSSPAECAERCKTRADGPMGWTCK
jgi:hypothetical protein